MATSPVGFEDTGAPAAPVYIRPFRAIQYPVPTTTPDGAIGTGPTVPTSIVADATVVEDSEDEIVITDHPVEVGSVVSDNSFKLPATLTLEYGWALGSTQNTAQDATWLKTLYAQLLSLQVNRTLCNIYTGKRAYSNMLIRTISCTTDVEHENILLVRIGCREIQFAVTTLLSVSSAPAFPPSTGMAAPGVTGGTVAAGTVTALPAPAFNPTAAAAALPGGPQ